VSNKDTADKKRLFFALWLDDKTVQHIKQNILKYFLPCQGHMVPENNWHITLAYFGASDMNIQDCLEEKAEKVISQPFELNLSKCGFWPRPRVAWLGVKEIPAVLKELMHDLQQNIQPCGFNVETRAYQPHVTLVRKAKHQTAVSEVDPITCKVTQFCLVESKTYPEGAQYTVLKRWDL